MRLKSLLTSRQINYRLHQIILEMQSADERMLSRVEFDTISTSEMRSLAAALISGDTQYIRTIDETEDQAALVPDWGSWIEGQPLTTAILSNRALLVDLLPLNPVDFAKTYRCTVGQFIAIIKWFQKHRKRIHINLRDLDSDRPETIEAYAKEVDSIGLILQEIDDNSVFYSLASRRNIIFSLADQGRTQDRQRLKRFYTHEAARIAEFYPALHTAYGKIPSDPAERNTNHLTLLGAQVRSGRLIAENQFAWRIAYYRAYREIFSDFAEGQIDELLANGSPNPVEFAELARLVTLFHHRFTAPLTGAFGGTYNLRMAEYGPMMAGLQTAGSREAIHGVSSHKAFTDAERDVWDWLATEKVRKKGKVLEDTLTTGWSMIQRRQIVQDETVDYILNQAKPITDEIQAYRDDLITAVRSSLLSKAKTGAEVVFDPAEYAAALENNDAADLVSEMTKAVQRVNCVAGPVSSSILMGFGVAFGIPGISSIAALKEFSTSAVFGINADGIGTLLQETMKDPTKSGLAGFVSNKLGRTSARMQIVSLLDDISAKQPRRN